MNLHAIILAAGQGTRMKSALPKVLHAVQGRPIVGHIVGLARQTGATRTVVVVGYGRDLVEGYLRDEEGGDDLAFVVQAEQLGTAHAVDQARPELEGRPGWTLILSGDVPNIDPAIMADFVQTGIASGDAVSFISCNVPDPTGYGRIVRNDSGNVLCNVEHRDATEAQRAIREINVGVYLVDNAFLWESLKAVGSQNAQGEFYLPDLFRLARESGKGLRAYLAPGAQQFEGINTRVQLARAEAHAQARRNEALMLSGITMIDPTSVHVGWAAEVSPDVTIEPNVQIKGSSTIGAGCVLGQGAVIEDATLEDGVIILPYSVVRGSTVRAGAEIGPFAHLQPGSDIGPDARIGNFVEIRNSSIGAGTKARHLTFLGDAQVGAGCNIGAGTITCNYDGVEKHPTVLGDNTFVGSNTALVAPINVGDGAYVGAGSTLTKDVADDALGVARGRQRNIEGWVRRFAQRKGDT